MQMDDSTEVGFILKRFFPQQKKISLLTRSKGKIILLFKKDKVCQALWPGMLISCEPIEYGNYYFVNSVEVISEVSSQQQYDIYWVHHLLELFYYFIPLADPSDRLFDQFERYLTILNHQAIQASIQLILKQLCIVHFLCSMGSYAMPQGLRYALALLSSPDVCLNDVEKEIINFCSYDVNRINRWIMSCLRKHPSFRSFKTVSFMYPVQTMVEL